MKKIFISYRRSDSANEVGRLHDNLKQKFGEENVFKDLDSIPAGVDFRKIISKAISECEVLLAVIGTTWLNTATEKDVRRIDDPNDFVQIEISEALKKGVPVIPVLLGNTKMPEEAELPIPLKDLAFRNAIPLRADPDFHNDVKRLSLEIVEHIPELANSKKNKIFKISAVISTLLIMTAIYFSIFIKDKDEKIIIGKWDHHACKPDGTSCKHLSTINVSKKNNSILMQATNQDKQAEKYRIKKLIHNGFDGDHWEFEAFYKDGEIGEFSLNLNRKNEFHGKLVVTSFKETPYYHKLVKTEKFNGTTR